MATRAAARHLPSKALFVFVFFVFFSLLVKVQTESQKEILDRPCGQDYRCRRKPILRAGEATTNTLKRSSSLISMHLDRRSKFGLSNRDQPEDIPLD